MLNQSLMLAEKMIDEGERDALKIKEAVEANIRSVPLAQIGYVEIRDAENLEPLMSIERPVVIALAVRFGNTRLIDNRVIGNTSPKE